MPTKNVVSSSDGVVPSSMELGGAYGASRLVDVERDLVDQILLALEGPLVPEPLPQLDHKPPAVQVALEIEQERFDAPLLAAVVRVGADRYGGTRIADVPQEKRIEFRMGINVGDIIIDGRDMWG